MVEAWQFGSMVALTLLLEKSTVPMGTLLEFLTELKTSSVGIVMSSLAELLTTMKRLR